MTSPTPTRIFSTPTDPYPGIRFVDRGVGLKAANTPAVFTAPEHWDQNSVDILATKYARRKGVPSHRVRVDEPGVPEWLRRCVPRDVCPTGGETDARQIFDRLSGCWTYWAWGLGYFGDTRTPEAAARAEAAALVFRDEVRAMLALQVFAPASPQWFNTGLHWAYGVTGPDAGQWAVSAAGEIVPAGAAYERPQASACFILGIKDDLTGPRGIYDTFLTEARIFKFGGGAGGNWGTLRGAGEPLSGGGVSSGMMSWLRIANEGGGAISSGGTLRRAAKMVCVPLDHPDVEQFVCWKAHEEYRSAAMLAGDAVLRRAVPAVKRVAADRADRVSSAAAAFSNDETPLADVIGEEFAARTSDEMDLAVSTPELEFVPDGTRRRAELAGRYGVDPVWPDEPYTAHFEGPGSVYQAVQGQNANNSVRVTNEFLRRVDADEPWDLIRRTDGGVAKTVKARDLWDLVTRAAWTCADPGVQFDDLINDWNTCPNDGRINATNPCAEYNWLPDTACNLASLNLVNLAVFGPRGVVDGVDLTKFRRAVSLVTTVLDVTVSMAAYPSEAVAKGSREYRTLGLGYANLGAFLMRSGIAYDSDAGRAWCAALTALMHAEATRTSADLAARLGAFPAFSRNREACLRVAGNHFAYACRLAKPATAPGYVGLSAEPPDQDGGLLPPDVRQAVDVWAGDAIDAVHEYGLRNAQLTLIAPTGTIGFTLGCDTLGIEPDLALVKAKKLVGGGRLLVVNQSLPAALAALGYSEKEALDVRCYVNGVRDLPGDGDGPIADDDADGFTYLTREWLAAAGLTEAEVYAVRQAVRSAESLEKAALAAIPPDRWAELLGVSVEWCRPPKFDSPLVALLQKRDGALDPGEAFRIVREVNYWVCGHGTVEGAPHLSPDHFAVFDCANRCGDGVRYIRPEAHVEMVAAAQPSVSGGISKTLNLPAEASPDDFKRLYRYGHSLAVKCMSAYADGQKLSQPLQAAGSGKRREPLGFFQAKITGGWSAAGPLLPPADPDTPLLWKHVTLNGSPPPAPPPPTRRELPNRRPGETIKFRIGGRQSFFVRTGNYPDGKLGEFFLTVAKGGSTLRALADAFAISVSLGLQYGVPLEEYVDAFVGFRFEPDGIVVGHDRIKTGKSFIDVLFRELAIHYLGRDELADVQSVTTTPSGASIRSAGSVPVTPQPVAPAPGGLIEPHPSPWKPSGNFCPSCGTELMVLNRCRQCPTCFWQSGGCG